jgi:hypothetical protein
MHTKHINALCEQNYEFFHVFVGGTSTKLWAFKKLDPANKYQKQEQAQANWLPET